MKVYRDLEYVRKRKRLSTLTAVSGIALLGAAWWFAWKAGPSGVILAYVPLLAGMVVFHLGMQQVGKWNRAQRNDVILDTLLKDLGERYSLIHYAKLGKRVVEHQLVYPGGVLTITARDLAGGVVFHGDRWRKAKQGIGRFIGLGGPFLGNPTGDAAADVAAVNALLAVQQLQAEVDAVVAFLNPRVELDVQEPDFPVTNAEGLKPYISSLPADASLQPSERQQIVALLTRDGEFEAPQAVPTRRPVKRRAA
ncbi:MAG: hypothetical protein U0031_08180 [Thermomicrobiales bacterium]